MVPLWPQLEEILRPYAERMGAEPHDLLEVAVAGGLRVVGYQRYVGECDEVPPWRVGLAFGADVAGGKCNLLRTGITLII